MHCVHLYTSRGISLFHGGIAIILRFDASVKVNTKKKNGKITFHLLLTNKITNYHLCQLCSKCLSSKVATCTVSQLSVALRANYYTLIYLCIRIYALESRISPLFQFCGLTIVVAVFLSIFFASSLISLLLT